MSLKIPCDTCGNELNRPAALLLLPPDDQRRSVKLHICNGCLPTIMLSLTELRMDNDLES